MLRRVGRILYWLTAALVSVVVVAVNLRLYYPRGADYGPDRVGPDVVAQLRFLQGALRDGAGERMQSLFPEGFFFSHVLYGLSWVEVGLRQEPGAPLRGQALREARWSLEQLGSSAGRAPFDQRLDPPLGVFYVGWTTWLEGGILKLQARDSRDAAEVAHLERDCRSLARAFDRSETPFLCAYPGQAWPVDSVVAIAALRLHDTLLRPRFSDTVSQ